MLGTKAISTKTSPIPHDFTVFCHSLHFRLFISTLGSVDALQDGAAVLIYF